MIYVKILCHNVLFTRIQTIISSTIKECYFLYSTISVLKRVLFGQLLKLVDTLKRLFVLAELQLNSIVAI